ncbi:hypothetical protein JX265_012367 [Neoarthrinium moseri]|uniref:Glycosyl transferase CAP10 domain-containing protein n=1 Tax=Neoarthrinium moseri TaxID=1658444 RepID=A0A9P9WAU4_9PEZI|nr:uncharacterized protein JN550_011185 [Neoarthrinium moseri]KAI1851551.1 hypothetical protein JX266_003013 [Neoarthrinium moseri]KAI1855012.1 hypothetical protein JX265_012367 [Neoarthrinium moseri]KAI1860870.1 hypothetical protein JN550_011185 [Neoarthrinium moseri]
MYGKERWNLGDISSTAFHRRLFWLVLAVLTTSTLFLLSRTNSKISSFRPPSPEVHPVAVPPAKEPVKVPEPWRFDTHRDGLNYGLSDEQCDAAFPDIFQELTRARDHIIKSKGSITKEDVHVDRKEEYKGRQHGEFHVMIFDGQLYIIKEVPGEPDRSRGLAALANMYRALSSIPDPKSIPNIEFIFDIEDVAQDANHKPDRVRWTWARRTENPWFWVMPDFDGWAYPDDGVASYPQFREDVAELELGYRNGWDEKPSKLSWRGSLAVNTQLRGDLVAAAKGHNWSDVEAIDWHDRSNIMAMQDFCRYQYVAHTEGNSWSGRLRYLHNCDSVPVIHKLDYVAHYYPLLKSSGPQQNFVEVNRNWSDLSEKMEYLIQHPDLARHIAGESTRVFRDRYLTPAAEACYWRRMFKLWRSVMSFEPQSHRVAKDGKIVRRGVSWERFAFRQEKSFEHGFFEEDKTKYDEED